MMPPIDSSSEFSSLMSNLVEGGLTPSQFDQLAQILEADPAARAVYRDHLSVHAMLYWRWHQQASETHQKSPRDSSSNATSDDWTAPQSDSELSPPLPGIDSPTSSFFGILSHAAHGTIGFFSQELPFALLIATLVTCLGLLAGSVVYVSHHKQLADNGSAAKPTLPPVQFNLDYVGRVTGMVDVQWSDDQTATVHGANVFLGRKFALASGLMEITYDTGAKVILQGPCTYQAESKTGGFLARGRLTAKLEKEGSEVRGQGSAVANHKSEIRNQKSPVPALTLALSQGERGPNTNPQSLIPNPLLAPAPMFAVRTPTAVVQIHRTPIRGEVDKHGGTVSYVFRGRVAVQPIATDGHPQQAVELCENESVRVDASSKAENPPTTRAAVDPSRFIRVSQFAKLAEKHNQTPFERWQAYSQQLRRDPSLLAYYTFEKHNQSTSVLPNQSPLGSVLDGKVENAEWVEGRIPGKLALYFHGPNSGDKVILPQQERFNFNGPFSVAVWFKAERFVGAWNTLISKGDTSWRLQYFDAAKNITFDTGGISKELVSSALPLQPLHQTSVKTSLRDNRYHLLVAVCEPIGDTVRKLLYVDGRLEGSDKATPKIRKNADPVCIGSMCIFSEREFSGWIDEVAILSRAMTANETTAMLEAGNPREIGPNGRK